MNREFLDFLKMNDVEYKKDALLSKISPIRIGAEADLIAYPDSEIKLIELVQLLEKTKTPYKILGRMSNMLPPDEKYEGVIVRTDRICGLQISGNVLDVYAGASMPSVALHLRDVGLSGFEGLSGIPGSIGGAIVGNAGAFGREISHLLLSVKAYDIGSDAIVYLSNDECRFCYRDSVFKTNRLIILSARFLLTKSDSTIIDAEMRRCREIRQRTQPTDKPSLGSAFKRPAPDISAARLIDECGLKGYVIGGARVSTKHAGFIINDGRATADDYIELLKYIQKCVFEKYKIQLKPEVEIM